MIIKTLYARNVTGSTQTWSIDLEGDKYRTISGQLNSPNMITTNWTYCESKNIGKKNETNSFEQASREVTALIKKKIKEGYKEDIEKIDEFVFFEPMLCKQFEDYKHKINYPVAYEDKLNGICCISTVSKTHSRKGEEFFCIEHIKNSILPLQKKYPGLILHGELFNDKYRNKLNRIASLVSVNRKAKDVTPEDEAESEKIVEFHVYDGFGFEGITKDTPYKQRKEGLKNLLKDIKYVFYHPYKLANSEKEVYNVLAKTRKNKTEGIVVKLLDGVYEQKRSKNIMKLKNFYDSEYRIKDIKSGTGNWDGCAKIITCELNPPAKDGSMTFDSNIRGDMETLRDLLENKENYIGQYCTVEFQELSEYGIPLIPYTQLPFRTYE